jgi:hypothetical protein
VADDLALGLADSASEQAFKSVGQVEMDSGLQAGGNPAVSRPENLAVRRQDLPIFWLAVFLTLKRPDPPARLPDSLIL